MERLVRRYARTHGPFEARAEGALRARPHAGAGGLERAGELVRGELRPGGTHASGATPRCCGGCAAPRSPRAQGDRARRPARAGALHAELAGRRPPPGGRRDRPPARARWSRSRAWRCRSTSGARRAAAPRRRLLAVVARPAVRRGRVVWVGAGLLGRRSGRVALYFREDVRSPPPPAPQATPEGGARCDPRAAPGTGAASSPTCSATSRACRRGAPGGAVGPRLGGEVTNDACAPLRSPKLTAAKRVVAEGARRPPPQLPPSRRPARSRTCRAAGR